MHNVVSDVNHREIFRVANLFPVDQQQLVDMAESEEAKVLFTVHRQHTPAIESQFLWRQEVDRTLDASMKNILLTAVYNNLLFR